MHTISGIAKPGLTLAQAQASPHWTLASKTINQNHVITFYCGGVVITPWRVLLVKRSATDYYVYL